MRSNRPPCASPPFHRWPQQHFDAAFGFAWTARPRTLVFQTTVEHGSYATAVALQDMIDHVLRTNASELEGTGGLSIVHDWRSLRGYSREARREWMDRTRGRRPGDLADVTIALAPTGSRLLAMAVEAGNLVATLALGLRVQLVHDLEKAPAYTRLRPPDNALSFPKLPK